MGAKWLHVTEFVGGAERTVNHTNSPFLSYLINQLSTMDHALLSTYSTKCPKVGNVIFTLDFVFILVDSRSNAF